MKTIFFKITFISFLLFGCGYKPYLKDSGKIDFQAGINLNAKISISEQSLALKMCYALKKKRLLFHTSNIGKTFQFLSNRKTCDNTNTSQPVSAILKLGQNASDPMMFDTGIAPSMFYKNVQTDSNGILKDICNSVLGGREPNLIVVNGLETSEIHFKKASDSTPYVEVITGVINKVTSESSIRKIEQFYIHPTNGRTIKIKSFFSCLKANVYDEYTQTQDLTIP